MSCKEIGRNEHNYAGTYSYSVPIFGIIKNSASTRTYIEHRKKNIVPTDDISTINNITSINKASYNEDISRGDKFPHDINARESTRINSY
jgi:hypothetical protein